MPTLHQSRDDSRAVAEYLSLWSERQLPCTVASDVVRAVIDQRFVLATVSRVDYSEGTEVGRDSGAVGIELTQAAAPRVSDLVREAVCDLLRSIGLPTKPFSSVPEFLKWKLPDGPSCLVLDVRLPGLSGLDFQSELNKANV